MASLVAKKKGNQLYYYVVESARVDGQPRIVHQAYLGAPKRLPRSSKTVPRPFLCKPRSRLRLPGSLWLAAQRTAFSICFNLSGFLSLRSSRRIICCWPPSTVSASPGRKPKSLIGMTAPSCAPSGALPRAFYFARVLDCFDRIPEEQLEQAQIRLLGLWKEKQLVSRRILAYDTTNFYTYVASTNERNHLAQRGHNKQGRHNLRQWA